jgi:hypothetical protein
MAMATPGVDSVVQFPGLNAVHFVNTSNAGLMFIGITPSHERDISAAEIAGEAVGLVKTGENAECCKARFLGTGEHRDFRAENVAHLGDEGRAIQRAAGRSGRQHIKLLDPHEVAEDAKPLQRGHRLFQPVFRQEAGDGDLASQAAQRFLVEHRHRRA